MRRVAKTINFGILYGLGSYGLSQQLRISRSEADTMIKEYFEKFSSVKEFIAKILRDVRQNGYTETITGHKRYFPDINHKNFNIRSASERAAINMPIQGSASDLMKIAMINIYQMFHHHNLKSKMILQIHDELLFEVAEEEAELVFEIVHSQMANALSLGEIPLEVIIEVGNN
jgi:DNA polymerase-1